MDLEDRSIIEAFDSLEDVVKYIDDKNDLMKRLLKTGIYKVDGHNIELYNRGLKVDIDNLRSRLDKYSSDAINSHHVVVMKTIWRPNKLIESPDQNGLL